jgi:hypothetical protein
MIKISWLEFKSLLLSKKISITFVTTTESYKLFISLESIIFNCNLFRDGGVDVIDFETNYKSYGNKFNGIISSPFSSKNIDGKGLFKRVHGIQKECLVGENIFTFVIPYTQCKITEIEIIGASNCDRVELEVYDNPSGTISGIPNRLLNQFGFMVNVSKDYYSQKSEYDADMIKDMMIEVHVYSSIVGIIGINFNLNELK